MKIGKGSVIHPTVQIFNGDMIEIGENTRIDAFCVLSGGIGLKIGSHIHIGCGSYLFGGGGIELEDFSGSGPGLCILSQSDDFSGESLISPCIPMKYKPIFKSGKVVLKRHSVAGTRVNIMPGVTVGEGAAIGACSMVNKDCEPWSIYAGIPAKKIKDRKKNMLELEKIFLEEYNSR